MAQKKQNPRHKSAGLNYDESVAGSYFAKRIFAACALAREAALRWTTPDFTALSIADT